MAFTVMSESVLLCVSFDERLDSLRDDDGESCPQEHAGPEHRDPLELLFAEREKQRC